MAKDLVCGMDVDENNPAATSQYKGITYYFCAQGCKITFDKDPEKYIQAQGNQDDHQHGHQHHGH